MDTSLATPIPAATASRPHPLLLVAAASVTVLSLLGIARLAGWMPAAEPVRQEAPALHAQAPVTSPPITVQQTVSLPPQAKPATPTASRPAEKAAVATTARRTPPVDLIESRPTVSIAAVSPLPVSPAIPVVCHDCGIVESVREIPVEGTASGGGAVVGGLLGGIVGKQFGQGHGRDLMTLIGIAGGAYAGNQLEKSGKNTVRREVVVRFEDGTTQTFGSDTSPVWRSGDRVRVSNGQLFSTS